MGKGELGTVKQVCDSKRQSQGWYFSHLWIYTISEASLGYETLT